MSSSFTPEYQSLKKKIAEMEKRMKDNAVIEQDLETQCLEMNKKRNELSLHLQNIQIAKTGSNFEVNERSKNVNSSPGNATKFYEITTSSTKTLEETIRFLSNSLDKEKKLNSELVTKMCEIKNDQQVSQLRGEIKMQKKTIIKVMKKLKEVENLYEGALNDIKEKQEIIMKYEEEAQRAKEEKIETCRRQSEKESEEEELLSSVYSFNYNNTDEQCSEQCKADENSENKYENEEEQINEKENEMKSENLSENYTEKIENFSKEIEEFKFTDDNDDDFHEEEINYSSTESSCNDVKALKGRIKMLEEENELLRQHHMEMMQEQLKTTMNDLDGIKRDSMDLNQNIFGFERLQNENKFLRHRLFSQTLSNSSLDVGNCINELNYIQTKCKTLNGRIEELEKENTKYSNLQEQLDRAVDAEKILEDRLKNLDDSEMKNLELQAEVDNLRKENEELKLKLSEKDEDDNKGLLEILGKHSVAMKQDSDKVKEQQAVIEKLQEKIGILENTINEMKTSEETKL